MNIGRKFERLIDAVEGPFDVAQYRVELGPLTHFGGGTAADTFNDRVRVVFRDNGAEGTQSVAVDLGDWMLLRSRREHLQREAGYRRHHPLLRVPRIGEFQGDHERHLVFRATSRFATVTRPSKIRIIHRHDTVKLAPRLTFGHTLDDLVLGAPSRAIAHAQVPHQLQRGHVGLALHHQIPRQESMRQRQLGAGEQRVGDQADLVPTGRTLPRTLAVTVGAAAVTPMLVARANKALRSTRSVQRASARRFRTILIEKAGQRQTELKLDTIHSHESDLSDGGCSVTQVRRIGWDCGLTSALVTSRFLMAGNTHVMKRFEQRTRIRAAGKARLTNLFVNLTDC